MDNHDQESRKEGSKQIQSSPIAGDGPPTTVRPERIQYPSRDGTYFSQLYNQPLVTTLSSFSHVANLVRNPYLNVDEFVRQAGNRRKHQRTSENFVQTLNKNRDSPTPAPRTVQEMKTFVAIGPNTSSSSNNDADLPQTNNVAHENQMPICVLPPIECTNKRGRLEPLTIEEYETKLRLTATDHELIERIFLGGMSSNQLRAALWPYLFGLINHRGSFEEFESLPSGAKTFVFIEHEGNISRWRELSKLYDTYEAQWKAILPDQETRFSAFRERKSLIERDVIRCDRLHPFYAEKPQNLTNLTNLLMTYMMYDFDIGYVQGMSDLGGPILYMYQGNLVKSFWIFVEVMKLFRRNFELTQKTIHFQLNCLYELIRHTDPIFAQYLEENDSSNCFFAFRAIVCQFKRELMKDDEDDYSKVLFLWDTIWCAKRRCDLLEEFKSLERFGEHDSVEHKSINEPSKPITEQPVTKNENYLVGQFDPNQSDTPRYHLTETEIFVLALCLSMIRRERDIIMANRLDGTDIHLHFINPKLANDLNSFIEHAINIYSFLKNDFDIKKLTEPEEKLVSADSNPGSPQGSAEGYDLLSDFLVINGASGS